MPQQRDSLLKQHQRILGYAKDTAWTANANPDLEEQERIERLRLPDLHLPEPKKGDRSVFTNRLPGTRWAWLSALVTALIITIAYWPESDDRVRIKGAHHVSVFWERDGQVEPWSEGTLLAAGDRVRAEVLASEPIVAYAAIADRYGRLLVSADQIHASAQTLTAGERRAFPGSFKLVGPSEGETLVVLTCAKKTLTTRLLEEMQSREESILTQNQLPKGCDMQLFPLR